MTERPTDQLLIKVLDQARRFCLYNARGEYEEEGEQIAENCSKLMTALARTPADALGDSTVPTRMEQMDSEEATLQRAADAITDAKTRWTNYTDRDLARVVIKALTAVQETR